MSSSPIYILGIESSCDDTSAAVISNDKILSNYIANQEIHRQYGGVVPELASRNHQENIVPVVHQALRTANIQKEQLSAIAYTRGPGLLGSLLVGSSFAKGLAMSLNIPLIEVNHMQAHVLAHFIDGSNILENQPKLSFPFLCLTVSGGHTQIVLVKNYFDFTIVGETIDDAAGEAYDKLSKMLGLEYPGGPIIDKYAQQGNATKFQFPKPLMPNFDFTFSGLKTSVLYFIQKESKTNPNFITENMYDICASFQHTVVSSLLHQLEKAAKEFQVKNMCIAGGVSANSSLRKELQHIGIKNNWNIYIPQMQYCTDNAAMIAIVGYYKFLEKEFTHHSIPSVSKFSDF